MRAAIADAVVVRRADYPALLAAPVELQSLVDAVAIAIRLKRPAVPP
jgi:hypothetical protein